MSRVEMLEAARNRLSVKFIEFTKVVSNGKYAIFFEGEDEKYYSPRINIIRSDIKWIGINCSGKKNVIELRRMIRTHFDYGNSLCMFFIDSDFDDNASYKNLGDIYLTPCYSIENLYTSSSAFSRIINAEFGVHEFHENDQCFKKAVEHFENTKSLYFRAIEDFNFLIFELKRVDEPNLVVNINNVNFEKLVDINLGQVTKLYTTDNPKNIFPELPDDLKFNFEAAKEFFKTFHSEQWFRGKQNLEFLRVFLEIIKKDRCSKQKRQIFKNKAPVKLHLTKSNCISELSQYADTPDCLLAFLANQVTNAA